MQSNQPSKDNVGTESKKVQQFGQTADQGIQGTTLGQTGTSKQFQSTPEQMTGQGSSTGVAQSMGQETLGQKTKQGMTSNIQGTSTSQQGNLNKNQNI